MVFPYATDLQEPARRALVAQAQLLRHAPALVVPRHDRRFHAVEAERLESVADHERDTFGDVAVARVLLVDPVTDETRLERPAQHTPETHLADKRAVAQEQTEAVRAVELALALPRAATGAERVAVRDGIG